MTRLQILASPLDLPTGEQHVTFGCPATLKAAVALMHGIYPSSRILWKLVYFTKEDNRYWFVLKNRKKGRR